VKQTSGSGDGRVGLYAGSCPRAASRHWPGGRPSISTCRCRQIPAVYPQASDGPPACAGPPPECTGGGPFRPCSGWGLPSRPGHPGRWCALAAPFHPCSRRRRTGGGGGLFSVALSRGSPRVGVADHPALWSPDVPRRHPHQCGRNADAAARPTRPSPPRVAAGRQSAMPRAPLIRDGVAQRAATHPGARSRRASRCHSSKAAVTTARARPRAAAATPRRSWGTTGRRATARPTAPARPAPRSRSAAAPGSRCRRRSRRRASR